MNTIIGFNPLGSPAQTNSEYPVTDLNSRLTRSNFFDGRLLTALDLTREQTYIDERLRELGRSHGNGIIHGFITQLASGILSISAGQAVAPSGRVLELNNSLTIDLNDSAAISLLNNGEQTYINRGLYAVVIQYAEKSKDLAEVFPTDLSHPAEAKANIIAEGIKISLAPLSEALSQQDEFSVREYLMSDAVNQQGLKLNLPEESVALGVMAFENHSPIWLDSELLRHPLRAQITAQSNNEDFFRRHSQLFNDILAELKSTAATQAIHARDFFSRLPPAGPIPKNSINTEKGTQNYFPEHFTVTIVPVNYNELHSILSESLSLRPIDLNSKDSQDIMLLAPLEEALYLNIAQKMEAVIPSDALLPQLLPTITPFPLSPFNSRGKTFFSADSQWQTIWNTLGENELFYIKRPQRAAETGVSAIVLARGAIKESVPPAEDTDAAITDATITDGRTDSALDILIPDRPSIVTINTRTTSTLLTPSRFHANKLAIVDEDESILRQVNLQKLAQYRSAKNTFEKNALNKLIELKGQDSQFILDVMAVLFLIERQYDSSLWRTLLQLGEKGDIQVFLQFLTKNLKDKESTASTILLSTKETGLALSDSLKKQWLKLSKG